VNLREFWTENLMLCPGKIFRSEIAVGDFYRIFGKKNVPFIHRFREQKTSFRPKQERNNRAYRLGGGGVRKRSYVHFT
jgi:hypothetical protein